MSIQKETFYVYEIVNKVTQRKYIGMTKRPKSRFYGHLSNMKRGLHSGENIVSDYIKYGRDSFYFRILETVSTRQEAYNLETKYIFKYQTYVPEFGYNGNDQRFTCNHSIPQKCSNTELGKRIHEQGYLLRDVSHLLNLSCRVFAAKVNNPECFTEAELKKIDEILLHHKYKR